MAKMMAIQVLRRSGNFTLTQMKDRKGRDGRMNVRVDHGLP